MYFHNFFISKLLTDSLFKLRLLFLREPFFTIMAFNACHATVSYSHQELPQRCLKVLAERWRFAVEIERDEVSQSGILHVWWGFFGLWTAAEEVQSCKPDAVIQRERARWRVLRAWGLSALQRECPLVARWALMTQAHAWRWPGTAGSRADNRVLKAPGNIRSVEGRRWLEALFWRRVNSEVKASRTTGCHRRAHW